jgi:hypothetical protein
MASDLLARLAAEERAKNPIGVPECLVDMSRRIHIHGIGLVDNTEALSKELAAEVTDKAFMMVVAFRDPGKKGLKIPGHCQVGFFPKVEDSD